MRIALSALSVKPGHTGGGEWVLRHFVRHLPTVDRENRYLIFVTKQNRGLFEVGDGVVDFVEAPTWVRSPALRVLYEFAVLPRVMRARSVDIFLAFNQVFSPWVKCKVVSFVQNLLYYQFEQIYRGAPVGEADRLRLWVRYRFYRHFNAAACRRAACIVAVSEVSRGVLEQSEALSRDRITVVPLALSEDLEKDPGSRLERCLCSTRPVAATVHNYFLCVGSIEPYKNIASAIEALAHVRSGDYRDIRLAIVGFGSSGYRKFLRGVANRAGVADATEFVGAVAHEHLSEWYRCSAGLLLLSECEAFPLPALEAMACGAPIIASNSSGVAELVADAGLQVNPRKPTEIAGAMTKLLDDENLVSALVQRGRNRVAQFSWRGSAAALARVIASVG